VFQAALKMGLLGADEVVKNGGRLKAATLILAPGTAFTKSFSIGNWHPNRSRFAPAGTRATVTAVFNKNANGFEGVRLSANPNIRAPISAAWTQASLRETTACLRLFGYGERLAQGSCRFPEGSFP